jgi:hypothetical protein
LVGELAVCVVSCVWWGFGDLWGLGRGVLFCELSTTLFGVPPWFGRNWGKVAAAATTTATPAAALSATAAFRRLARR